MCILLAWPLNNQWDHDESAGYCEAECTDLLGAGPAWLGPVSATLVPVAVKNGWSTSSGSFGTTGTLPRNPSNPAGVSCIDLTA
jgi:hypothetical protein